MSWIDEARLKRAKRERERRAVEEANRAVAAKARAIEAARQAKESNKFAREVERLLPRGVELAGVLTDLEGPVARVQVRNGVQFDLRPLYRFPEVTSRGSTGKMSTSRKWYRDWNRYGGNREIQAFEVGSDYSISYQLGSMLTPNSKFSKAQMAILLLEALEKHDAKRRNR